MSQYQTLGGFRLPGELGTWADAVERRLKAVTSRLDRHKRRLRRIEDHLGLESLTVANDATRAAARGGEDDG